MLFELFLYFANVSYFIAIFSDEPKELFLPRISATVSYEFSECQIFLNQFPKYFLMEQVSTILSTSIFISGLIVYIILTRKFYISRILYSTRLVPCTLYHYIILIHSDNVEKERERVASHIVIKNSRTALYVYRFRIRMSKVF